MNFWWELTQTAVVIAVILFGIVFAVAANSKRIKRRIKKFWDGDDEL